MRRPFVLKDVFESRFMPEPMSGCWLWLGAVNHAGYGLIDVRRLRSAARVGPAFIRAHRLSYELYRGEIPDGLIVCHQCDLPLCVNPDHLFLGTNASNAEDSRRKGRNKLPVPRRGVDHHGAKVTVDDVLAIRACGLRLVDIAAKWGISVAQASNIRSGRQWKCVEG